MRVQKHVSPDISAAPSISTPFFPPSLRALATFFSATPAALAASHFGHSYVTRQSNVIEHRQSPLSARHRPHDSTTRRAPRVIHSSSIRPRSIRSRSIHPSIHAPSRVRTNERTNERDTDVEHRTVVKDIIHEALARVVTTRVDAAMGAIATRPIGPPPAAVATLNPKNRITYRV
tara:strand:+ start:2590 stop:3114 length:525 start_codon:yes stop_codon:yes gene_type:complete